VSLRRGTNMGKLNEQEIAESVESVVRDGFCVLRDHLDTGILNQWYVQFLPLLERHVERDEENPNRGPRRYYVTIPFTRPFAEPSIFEDPDILKIVRGLVGQDAVMCQLATDTPLRGSDFQDIHRDAPPLFPETGEETPAFQLAVNFPLVDVVPENGPFEVARRTHMVSKEVGLGMIKSGAAPLEPILMNRGDVMIRDVRGLHRGTPNGTDEPRPMVVIGYSRKWLYRPEVSIRIPRNEWEQLSEHSRHLLRFNPVIESSEINLDEEIYQSFAY
jgi:ectoine hydroxylase-related dioxygenase (phytanoyl-CoA dioxygenase family)